MAQIEAQRGVVAAQADQIGGGEIGEGQSGLTGNEPEHPSGIGIIAAWSQRSDCRGIKKIRRRNLITRWRGGFSGDQRLVSENLTISGRFAEDVGAVTKDTLKSTFSNSQSHFLIGPRYGFYNHSRFTPFAEVLFGAGHGSVSTDVSQFSPITLPDHVSARLTASRTSFAMMAGGGLDIRLTKHLTYRLFDADYYLTRPVGFITGENVNKNNFRLTTGANFTWGAAR